MDMLNFVSNDIANKPVDPKLIPGATAGKYTNMQYIH